jgi:hypothetical protein
MTRLAALVGTAKNLQILQNVELFWMIRETSTISGRILLHVLCHREDTSNKSVQAFLE